WHQAGRHRDARRAIAGFPEKYATEQMRSDLRALRARYHRTVTRLEQAEKHLAACAKEVTEPKHKLLAEAAGALLKELHYDNVERLDAFLGQAAQAERLKARKKKPELGPAQLLALAVSGWLLGSPSAESSPQVAMSLWKTRQLVLDYQKADDAGGRRKLL